MLFNSIDFIFFLPIVIISYYAMNAKYRWALLLAASYYFYMSWKVEYVVLILISTLVDYYCGIQMGKRESKRKRRPFLLLSLGANLGLLMGFKYFNFFSQTATDIAQSLSIPIHFPIMDFLLPVGISFYTFQTLSYSIDVFKGNQKPERHLGYFALYVSFFPQLVAGPIERFSSLAPQLKKHHTFNYENLKFGARLILFGLFIKMVGADNFAPVIDAVYSDPDNYTSFSILTAIVFYSFQIYCDFFGYSLIAIGSARLMGIHLMDNFKTPYLSTNIADFWKRWHISLSTWFRDYLYFSLGGNRTKYWRWMLNILLVFIISGFWHGANFTFIIWGLIFGVFYLLENGLNKLLKINTDIRQFSIKHFGLALKTFTIVTIAWVFFRSASIEDALHVFEALFSGEGVGTVEVSILVWGVFAAFVFTDILLFNKRFDQWIDNKHIIIRWSTYSVLLVCIVFFAGVDDLPFIYFQF